MIRGARRGRRGGTVAPDGTGTLSLRTDDEQTTLEARDIPTDDLWTQQPELGRWDALLSLPSLSPGGEAQRTDAGISSIRQQRSRDIRG